MLSPASRRTALRALPVPILICLCLWLSACSSGTPTLQLPDGRVWWPPETPRQPQRLSLAHPEITDPLEWWAANVLSQIPQDAYSTAQQRRVSEALIAEANATRAEYGLPPVQVLLVLNRVAQAAAFDEATRDYWSHKTPEGLGSRDRIRAAGGGTVSLGGENSSINTVDGIDAAGVIDGWEHHPGHRELLLNPDVKYVGAGTAYYSRSEFQYFVMLLVDFEPDGS